MTIHRWIRRLFGRRKKPKPLPVKNIPATSAAGLQKPPVTPGPDDSRPGYKVYWRH